MTFYPEDEQVPKNLITEKFVIRPLTPAHVALDYAALMENKERLRLWSGTPWPADDFTLAENLADLEWHWSEHQERIAFTYTVLNLTEGSCLGCVYIKSMTELLAHHDTWKLTAEPIQAHNALVRFWTTQNQDKSLLSSLRKWFKTEWVFPEVYWHTPANYQQQIAMFQNCGLTSLGQIQMPNRGGSHILFK